MLSVNLKIARLKKGIKQRELASKVGVTQQYIGSLENNKYSNPTKKTMLAISKVLDVSVQELFFDEDNEVCN